MSLLNSVQIYFPKARIQYGRMLQGFPTVCAKAYAQSFNETSQKMGLSEKVKFGTMGVVVDFDNDGKWDWFVTKGKPGYLWFESWNPQFLFRPK